MGNPSTSALYMSGPPSFPRARSQAKKPKSLSRNFAPNPLSSPPNHRFLPASVAQNTVHDCYATAVLLPAVASLGASIAFELAAEGLALSLFDSQHPSKKKQKKRQSRPRSFLGQRGP